MKLSFLKIGYIGLFAGFVFCLAACSHKKVALDQDRFTALLIDMHMADGTLSHSQGYSTNQDKKNYAYYNAVFDKYGITRADFDSCLYYYSSQIELFNQIYDAVIDTLNRRLTEQDRRLKELKSRDSVNYFPDTDTLLLDAEHPVWVVEIDSIVPGYYKFSTTVKLDTVEKKRENRIVAFFLSPDRKDTLQVRKIRMMTDTMPRHYNWAQYADSSFNRLVIKIADTDRPEKLNYKRGRIWGTTLFRPYTSASTEERLKKSLPMIPKAGAVGNEEKVLLLENPQNAPSDRIHLLNQQRLK